MNKSLYRWLLRLSLLIFLVACSPKAPQTATVTSSASSEPSAAAQTRVLSSQPSEVVTDVTQLRRTDYFCRAPWSIFSKETSTVTARQGGITMKDSLKRKGKWWLKAKRNPMRTECIARK